jgi:hypothetical protein
MDANETTTRDVIDDLALSQFILAHPSADPFRDHPAVDTAWEALLTHLEAL